MKKIFFLRLTLGAIVSNLQARKDVHHAFIGECVAVSNKAFAPIIV